MCRLPPGAAALLAASPSASPSPCGLAGQWGGWLPAWAAGCLGVGYRLVPVAGAAWCRPPAGATGGHSASPATSPRRFPASTGPGCFTRYTKAGPFAATSSSTSSNFAASTLAASVVAQRGGLQDRVVSSRDKRLSSPRKRRAFSFQTRERVAFCQRAAGLRGEHGVRSWGVGMAPANSALRASMPNFDRNFWCTFVNRRPPDPPISMLFRKPQSVDARVIAPPREGGSWKL